MDVGILPAAEPAGCAGGDAGRLRRVYRSTAASDGVGLAGADTTRDDVPDLRSRILVF